MNNIDPYWTVLAGFWAIMIVGLFVAFSSGPDWERDCRRAAAQAAVAAEEFCR